MCGIVGMYNLKTNNLQHDYFRWCLTTMQRRGPDAQSIWHNNKNYIAGFVRLSIRDLSSNGDQPMLSDCGNYCISFNGEIYNTQLLLQLLKPYRSSYKSTSDTELLLYALIHLGIDKTLEIIDGIFAFAFYALKQDKLILARDRLGIKPLYIGTCSEGVVYSSQYDHIINHSYCKDQPFNESVVASYLSLGYMPENSGVINNTKMLPHGYYCVIDNGGINTYRYYNYFSSATAQKITSVDAVLDDAVSSQLVSDVAIGTFMSGGVDSTLVSYFANKHTYLKSFTVGVTDSLMDESNSAAAFANIFKTDHFCKYISSKDLLNLIDDNVKAFSEPFADYSSLPTLFLSKFARESVTVALSGDGGDELFWGYPRNRKALSFIPYYQKLLWQRRAKLIAAKIKNSSAVELVRHWSQADFMQYYYSTLSIAGAVYWVPQICKAKPTDAFFYEDCKDTYKLHNNTTHELMNIVRKMEVDIHLQRILLKVDRAGMYHSLEVRVPLLNNEMLLQSLNYNFTDCIKGSQGKMNLKQSLIEKSNNELVLQPKKGFTIPMDEWLRKEICKDVTEKIMDMPQHLSMMFNRNQIQQLLSKHMSGAINSGWFIWAIYSLVTWDATHRNKYTTL
ncbi:MAG TPA: asparagine synthase (glutamine-hydrolyzing) [Panacibacter sp.]|nr:asparagine synthase (glutamine-hydrolyzing) [Panacibacter sp.]